MPPAGGPRKVKPKKVRRVKAAPKPVKPPAGDVASSGGDYGKKRAAPQVKKELVRIRATRLRSRTPRATLISSGRRSTAPPSRSASSWPAPRSRPDTRTRPSRSPRAARAPRSPSTRPVARLRVSPPSSVTSLLPQPCLRSLQPPALPITSLAPRSFRAPARLSATPRLTPTRLRSPPRRHWRIWGRRPCITRRRFPVSLLAPYKELAKHPGKFFTEHPVSTALDGAAVREGSRSSRWGCAA
jgi:hypothetical protein